MIVRLQASADAAIRRHGEQDYPREACGVLLGRAAGGNLEVLEAHACGNANTERAADRYLIEPKDQLRVEKDARARGLDVVGYYHSHPDHPSQASATDLAQSWEGVLYIILAVKSGTAQAMQGWWRSNGKSEFNEETLTLVSN